MLITNRFIKRAGTSLLTAAAVTGVVFAAAPAASAIPQNCTAGDLANVSAGVSAASAAYLFTHPDVNAFLTGLRDDSDDQASTDLEQYLNANPQVREELRAIRQPLEDLKAHCAGS